MLSSNFIYQITLVKRLEYRECSRIAKSVILSVTKINCMDEEATWIRTAL